MKTIDIMTHNPVFLKEGDAIRHAAQVLEREGIEAAPVLDNADRPIGLFSKIHLFRVINEKLPAALPVREVMTAPVTTFSARAPLRSLLSTDLADDPPVIPITDDRGRLTGVITRRQYRQALQSQFEQTENKLNTLLETNELNKELDAIIDSVYEGLYITDGEANTLRINKAYTRMTGIRPEEVIGKNMENLVEKGIYSESVTLHVLEKKSPSPFCTRSRAPRNASLPGIPFSTIKTKSFGSSQRSGT